MDAAAGRAPHSSAAEAGRCVVNEAGLWEGKGQAQALACCSAGWGSGPAAAPSTLVMLVKWNLSCCSSGCCLWVHSAAPWHWGIFTHTSALDNPLCATLTGCPREIGVIPHPCGQCWTSSSGGHTGTRGCSAWQHLTHTASSAAGVKRSMAQAPCGSARCLERHEKSPAWSG